MQLDKGYTIAFLERKRHVDWLEDNELDTDFLPAQPEKFPELSDIQKNLPSNKVKMSIQNMIGKDFGYNKIDGISRVSPPYDESSFL